MKSKKKSNKDIEDIRNDASRKKHADKKNEYRTEYIKVIGNDIEILRIEKSRIKYEMYRGTLPHSSITAALVISILMTLVQVTNTCVSGIVENNTAFKIFIPFLFSAIYLLIILCIFDKPIGKQQYKLVSDYLRLEILGELEKELIDNGEIKNYNIEALEEVAADIKINDEIFNKECKKKIRLLNWIKGLIKRDTLAKDIEKLILLNEDNLSHKKYYYIKRAKLYRDYASNIKNFIGLVTILISVIGIFISIFSSMLTESNQAFIDISDSVVIFGYRIILIYVAIIVISFIYDAKASHYETLVEYIKDELLKN